MFRPLAATLLSFCIVAPAAAQTAAEKETVKALIWAKEQAVYAERAKGSITPYISNAAPEYKGWPPFSRTPYGVEGIKQNEGSWAGQAKERLTMELKDFIMRGDTAVIFYVNSRTAMPDGTPVNEQWEIIRTWVKVGDDWKILSGMQRAGGLERPKR